MTSLPTPVVQTEFSDLTRALFSGLNATGAIISAGAADVARDQARTTGEQRIAQAQQSAILADERVANMQQRLVNEELRVKYEQAVELERLGLIKLIADATPEEATQFLAKYRFIDPRNRSRIAAQHGRTIATLEIEDAQKTILEYFSRENVDPQGLTAEGLMATALIKHEGLLPEAKLAFQNTFLGQAQNMILGQVITGANKRQAAGVRRGVIDRAQTARMFFLDSAEWDEVLDLNHTLQHVDGEPRADSDFPLAIRQAIIDVLPNYEGRYDQLLEKFDGLPEEIRKQLPTIGGKSGVIMQAKRHQAQIAANKERSRGITRLRQLKGDTSPGVSDQAELLVDQMSPELQADPTIQSLLRQIADNSKDMNRMRDEFNMTAEEIAGVGDLFKNFHTQYNGTESVMTLRGIARQMGKSEAMNRIAGARNEYVGQLIVWADTDQEAERIAELFKDNFTRARVPAWVEATNEKLNAGVEAGDVAEGVNINQAGRFGLDPELKSSQAVFRRLQRQMVLDMAEEFADPGREARPQEDSLDDAHKAAIINFANTHTSINGIAADAMLLGVTGGGFGLSEDDPDHILFSALNLLDTRSSLNGGSGHALLQMFRHVDGFTYIPAVNREGAGAFLKWNPNNHSQYSVITESGDKALFDNLNQQLRQEYPDAKRIANSDLAWHSGMKSKYISDNDAIMFPGSESRGYWKGGLQPLFNVWYTQQTGRPLPDFANPPPLEDLPGDTFAVAQHEEDVRVFKLLLGTYLVAHGYRSTLRDLLKQVKETPEPVNAP